jgi:hypothetical protein
MILAENAKNCGASIIITFPVIKSAGASSESDHDLEADNIKHNNNDATA